MLDVPYDQWPDQWNDSGRDFPVAIWWEQSWGCDAVHFSEDIPESLACDHIRRFGEWND